MTFADDAGEYSVFAKSPLGEVSASAGLLEEGGFPSPRPASLAVMLRDPLTPACCPRRGIRSLHEETGSDSD